MEAIASTVYDLTISVELMDDGTVRVVWATGEPGHVGNHFDDGTDEQVESLHEWVQHHTLSQLAKLADEKKS